MFNSRSLMGAGAALAAASLLWTGTLLAQRDDYKVAPGRDASFDVKPDAKPADLARAKQRIRDRRNAIRETLLDSGIAFNKEKEAEFDKWYLGYEFPTLTLDTPEALKDLYEGRKRLFRDELGRAENQQAKEHLVNLAFKFFQDVAREDYHPAVRYNAMLIVGDLNARESNRSGTGTPPLPLRAALDYMIKELKNPDQIDAVRLAALLGIARHVQIDAQADTFTAAEQIPQTELQEIRTLALDLVRTREAPAGRTQDGHDWMRRRGVEILSWLAAAKLDQEIVDEIIARLSDSDENRSVRCEAALALNTVNYLPERSKPRLGSTPVSVKPKEVAANLLQFVVDAASEDVARVDKYIKSMEQADAIYTSSGGGGAMSGRMSPRGSGSSMRPPSPSGKGSMGPTPGGSSMRPPSPSGKGSMGPTPGGSSMGPRPGGGSSMGPRAGSGSRMKAMGSYGSFGSGETDPYSYRLEPVYRKLRYEIACAMKGLRGTDELRRGEGTGGLYKLWPKPAAEADASKQDPTVKADKEFLDRCAKALKKVADKLKLKEDELNTKDFVVDKLSLSDLTTLINEVIVKAKPAKPAEGELEDPLSEPDPAEDVPEPTAKPTAKPAATAAAKAAAEPEPEPGE